MLAKPKLFVITCEDTCWFSRPGKDSRGVTIEAAVHPLENQVAAHLGEIIMLWADKEDSKDVVPGCGLNARGELFSTEHVTTSSNFKGGFWWCKPIDDEEDC